VRGDDFVSRNVETSTHDTATDLPADQIVAFPLDELPKAVAILAPLHLETGARLDDLLQLRHEGLLFSFGLFTFTFPLGVSFGRCGTVGCPFNIICTSFAIRCERTELVHAEFSEIDDAVVVEGVGVHKLGDFAGRFDQLFELFGVAHLNDLLVILGHRLEDEDHLLVAQLPTGELLLGEGREEVSIGAGETNTVVNRSGFSCLFLFRLVLLEDTDEGLDGPHGVGCELLTDISGDVFVGQFHTPEYGHDL
jgi:hypothetical protein